MSVLRVSLALITVVLCWPAAASALWPMEGSGVARQNAEPGFTARPPFGVLWSRGNLARSVDRTLGFIEHASTVGGGRLYVQVINGTVTALDARTGDVRWRKRFSRRASAAPAYNARRNTVVVQTLEPGRLLVLNARNGRVRWMRWTGGGEPSPLLTRTGITVAGRCACVTKYSWAGRRMWRVHVRGKVTASVALAGRKAIVVDYSARVTAIHNRTGRVLWRNSTRGQNYASPAVSRRRVFVASRDGRLHAFSTRSGRKLWSRSLGYGTGGARVNTAPAVARGRVYASSMNGWVYCYRPTGTRCWRKRWPGSVKGALATTGTNLVWACHRDSRYRNVRARVLRAYSWRTGRLVWDFPGCSHAPISTDGRRLYVHGFARIYAVARKG